MKLLPPLMVLYTFQLFSSSAIFSPLFHFSPLCSFPSQLYHSLTFTPNRVLIFLYSLILFATAFFPTLFLTRNVLGLIPHNTDRGKSEMRKWGAEKQWQQDASGKGNPLSSITVPWTVCMSVCVFLCLKNVCVSISLHVCECVGLEL